MEFDENKSGRVVVKKARGKQNLNTFQSLMDEISEEVDSWSESSKYSMQYLVDDNYFEKPES